MSVVVDMPPMMVQRVNEFAEREGRSFRELLCLSVEMYLNEQERRHEADVSAWNENFAKLLNATPSRNDKPYQFSREDAYEAEASNE